MFCSTQGQAERVALAGAVKMDAAGYTFTKVGGGLVEVGAPFLPKPYLVQTDSAMVEMMGGGFCSCAFAENNSQFGTCKHLLWSLKNLADEEHYAEIAQSFKDYCDERYAHDAHLAEIEMASAR